MTTQDMTTSKKALEVRARVKKKKPNFVRQESWRFRRLKENWRKPRGLDNKMRKKIKGWPPSAGVGYRGPKIARGLHPSGYKEVHVYNTAELKKIDPKTQAIRIAHTVGRRKRARILVEARKKKIIVLNLKEAKEVVKEEKKVEEKKEKEEVIEKETEEKKEEKRETEKPKPKRGRKSKDKKVENQ